MTTIEPTVLKLVPVYGVPQQLSENSKYENDHPHSRKFKHYWVRLLLSMFNHWASNEI